MAEKPRLKKSDDILSSLPTEPSRKKKSAAASSRADADADAQREDTSKKAKANTAADDTDELDAGPELPSAQSLAEKLIPKANSRTRGYDPYSNIAPPKSNKAEPAKSAASAQQVEIAPPKASAPASAEFDLTAPNTKSEPKPPAAPRPAPTPPAPKPQPAPIPAPAPAPVQAAPPRQPQAQPQAAAPAPAFEFSAPTNNNIEFQPVSAASTAPFIEFESAAATAPPPPRPQRPAPQRPPEPEQPMVRVAEFNFPSFEEAPQQDTPSREFSLDLNDPHAKRRASRESTAQKLEAENRGRREPQEERQPRQKRIIMPIEKEKTSSFDLDINDAEFSFDPPTFGEPLEIAPEPRTARRKPEPEYDDAPESRRIVRNPEPEFEPEPEPRRARRQSQFEPEPEPESRRVMRKPEPDYEDDYEPEPESRRVVRKAEPEPRRAAREPEPAFNSAPPRIDEPVGDKNRSEFLKRLSNQFELDFEERFETEPPEAREQEREHAPPRREPAKPDYEPPKSARGPRPSVFDEPTDYTPSKFRSDMPHDEEDFLSFVHRQERSRRGQSIDDTSPRGKGSGFADDKPALDFISRFENDLKHEELERNKDFRSQFEKQNQREQERHLKDDSGAKPQGQPRRKLDFQIQPEMHTPIGIDEKPAPKPQPQAPQASAMTYSRAGTVRPQVDTDDADADIPMPKTPPVNRAIQAPAPQINVSGKKSGEQLLLEHSMRSRLPAEPTPTEVPQKLKFTFATPDEQVKLQQEAKESLVKKRFTPNMILVAVISAVIAMGLLAWPIAKYIQLEKQIAKLEPTTSSAPTTAPEDTLNVYNSLSFDNEPKEVNNVIFKNSNVTLKNVKVNDYVIIEGVDGDGKIRLEDVNVSNAITVKATGVSQLELHNVKAARVVINNSKAKMVVSATGNTDINTVEVRSQSTVKQAQQTADSPGIHSVQLLAPEDTGEISAVLDGLSLTTLDTSAKVATTSLENNTRIENLSSDGSLNLTGLGKVVSLSIGNKVGQGAGDAADKKEVNLFVNGVSISNLQVKSATTLNAAASIDNLSTASPVVLGGGAEVGTFTLNAGQASSSRLLIDIVAATVQSVYSNTPSRINITGSSKVNVISCDASTYVLGNRVNHLIANADGVIYENEPDKKTIASGVPPPQSKADNPNLDYDLVSPTATATSGTGATTDNLATTCGHARELGAFTRGDGSKDSPFEVSNPLQLSHVAAHLTSHFIQAVDIDLSAEPTLANGFNPIGNAAYPFEGVYNGQGYGVSRLRILSQLETVGLFGANKGQITSVRVLNGEISSASASASSVGAIVGHNLLGGLVKSCSNGAAVTGNQNSAVGGIVGTNNGGKVQDCYNYAKVSGVQDVGGIVGKNVSGASIAGCYNVGAVDATDIVGAVVGLNSGATIANSYFLAGSSTYGIGDGDGTAVEKTSEELQQPQMAADLMAGNDTSLWVAGSPSASYRFPVHRRPDNVVK